MIAFPLPREPCRRLATNRLVPSRPTSFGLRTVRGASSRKRSSDATWSEAIRTASGRLRATASAGIGWLESDNPAVRLVAVEAMTRNKDVKMLPRLLDALDDPHLINRQFAYKGLQEMLNLRQDDFGGYRFYMTSEERRKPLAELRVNVLNTPGPKSP